MLGSSAAAGQRVVVGCQVGMSASRPKDIDASLERDFGSNAPRVTERERSSGNETSTRDAQRKNQVDRALDVFKSGYEANDNAKINQGIKMLENAANNGSGEAAFNLAALFAVESSPWVDQKKACIWTLRAANLAYVNSYWGAASCELKGKRSENKMLAYDRYAMPWVRKLAAEGDEEDRKQAKEMIEEWDRAMAQSANGEAVALGSLFSVFGIASIVSNDHDTGRNKNAESSSKTYLCRIYCNSSSEPIVKHAISAAYRKEAAVYLDKDADRICRENGYSLASSRAFSGQQCEMQ